MLRNIILVFAFCIGASLYMINFRTSKLQYQVNRAVSKKKLYENRLLYGLVEKTASFIYPHIKLNEDKRAIQVRMMQTASLSGTPEQYLAQTISEMLLMFAIGIVLFLSTNNGVFFVLTVIVCSLYYLQKNKILAKNYKYIQKEVSLDLAKLCNVINGNLNTTSSVENILKSFYPIANAVMKKQLDITLTDMRTSSIPIAIANLENRIRLPRLSDICRGLSAIHNGNDQRLYFEIKSNEIMREYETMIEQDIIKRPGKLRLFQGLMFVLFLICLFYPFLDYISKQFSIFS